MMSSAVWAFMAFGERLHDGASAVKNSTFRDVQARYPAFHDALTTGKPVAETDVISPRNRWLQ